MPKTKTTEEDKEVEYQRAGVTNRTILARQCFKRRTPTRNLMDNIFSQMNYDVEESTANHHEDPISLAFQHESLCIQRPVIWIPNDRLGISDDEISCLEQQYSNVRMSNEHTCLDEKGRVKITHDASDAS